MNLLGIHLTLLIGPTVPIPAPIDLMESLKSVEVTHTDEGRSGFQITFQVGRAGLISLDYSLLNNPLLRPCNRVVMIMTFDAMPRVLMDGIITDQQLTPQNEPGASTLSVMGEDVSIMMDQEEKSTEHLGLDETLIAYKILLGYPQYLIIPNVTPPPSVDVPLPIDRVPVQQCTDLEQLEKMAKRYGYVFYISPGPAPMTNTAYWGPPKRLDFPQRPLAVNMGPNSNVDSINFRYNALSATNVSGTVQDRQLDVDIPVQNVLTTRIPLSAMPALLAQSCLKKKRFRAEGGISATSAMALAQGDTDASMDSVVEADGQLDALRYGDLLQARGVVCLSGAGLNYDGLYYVKRVTHTINKGSYKQQFTLRRDGTMPTTGGCPLGLP